MRTILATLHSKYIHASLALPYLAAHCRSGCGELQIREFTVHEPRDAILAALLEEQPDVVAFSVYLWNRRETFDLVDSLATTRPDLHLVVGGPEVSFDGPELFARHPGLTALVHGEGEEPLRRLLAAWAAGIDPGRVPRVTWRCGDQLDEGPDGPPLVDLDAIPSPFQLGLVNIDRRLVYFETSRGCPFHCSFCLSASEPRVRYFSLSRVYADLRWLMEHQVPQVKVVDRTFNSDPDRAREIFAFILAHNRITRFHFEIAAHLLDDKSLDLLDHVPQGWFQFEIGVQSTLTTTLQGVARPVALERLEQAVRRLKTAGRIHLHLDLVAGLPGEGYADFLTSVDRVAGLGPDHLQVELVKLLPGTPLRAQAGELGLRFDPNPPYTVLATPQLPFAERDKLRILSRLLDLTWNTGCFPTFMAAVTAASGSLARGLERLGNDLAEHAALRHPSSRVGLAVSLGKAVGRQWQPLPAAVLRDALAFDLARCERIVPGQLPTLFDMELDREELAWVAGEVQQATTAVRGLGVKLQHFAAAFRHLPGTSGRTVCLFLYRIRSGSGMTVETRRFSSSPPI